MASVPIHIRPLDRLVMRDTAQMILPDTVVLLRYRETATNAHGFPVVDWAADLLATRCSFTPSGGQREKDDQAGQVLLAQGRVRFAHGTLIDHRDRLRLVTRFGVVLTHDAIHRTYELTERPLTTESGVVMDVRLLTNSQVAP